MTPEQTLLMEAVAAQLGLQPAPGFDAKWARVFALPDDGTLYFSNGRQRGLLSISASVAASLRDHKPYYRDGQAPKTNINLSEAKGARRIAADVRRRLLPEYEREVSACKANKARRDDHNATRVLALSKVAAPFNEQVRCDDRSGEPRPLSINREGKFRLTAKPFCDVVNLQIDVSTEIAGKIAVMLAAL